MDRIQNKKNLAAVVLAAQGNKAAFMELYDSYVRDVSYLCSTIIGVNLDLHDVVDAVFIKLYRNMEIIGSIDSFESRLFTIAIKACNAYIRMHKDEYEDDFEQLYPEQMTVPSADAVFESFSSYDESLLPHDRKAVSFFSEMVQYMPVLYRTVLMYMFFTDHSFDEIAEMQGVSVEEVREAVVNSYSYLARQTERCRLLGYDFEKFVCRLPEIPDMLSKTPFVPVDRRDRIADAIGFEREPVYSPNYTPSSAEDGEMSEADENSPTVRYPDSEIKSLKIIKTVFIAAVVLILAASGYLVYRHFSDKPELTATVDEADADDGHIWNGTVADSFESGSGTKADPYIISNGSQLAYFASLINSGDMKYFACSYKLSGNIVLNDVKNFASWNSDPPENSFTPAGYCNSDSDYGYFCGTFDGNGCKIVGLYTEKTDYSGLFGYISGASVTNLILEKAYINGGKYAGGIAGCFRSSSSDTSVFSCCGVSGVINGEQYVGGMIGFADTADAAGGLSIDKCANYADIRCSASSCGGIIGFIQTKNSKTNIVNCINGGSISASDNAGGIAGANQLIKGSAVIENCINTGTVTCTHDTVGAIAGLNDSSDKGSAAEVRNCVWLKGSAKRDVSQGENSKVSTVSLEKTEMKTPSNYKGFDFSVIWGVFDNGEFPALNCIYDIVPANANPEKAS